MIGDLAELRADAELEMIDTLDILRATHARTASGGVSETWMVIYPDVKCLAGPMQFGTPPWEREINERIGSRVYWNLTLPYSTDIKAADRVQLSSGKQLEIVAPQEPRSYDILLRAFAVEIS